jgi:hypothetical protein
LKGCGGRPGIGWWIVSKTPPVHDDGFQDDHVWTFNGCTNIVFANIAITNISHPASPGNGQAIVLANCSGGTISNCVIITGAAHNIVCYLTGGTNGPGPTIVSNEFAQFNTAIELAGNYDLSGSIYSSLLIASNNLHDPHLAVTAGNHAQAIHIYGPYDTNHNPTAIAGTNAVIAGNVFSGDWSSGDSGATTVNTMIYSECGWNGLSISNNSMTFDNNSSGANGSQYILQNGFIAIWEGTNVSVTHNTLFGGGVYGAGIGSHNGIQVVMTSNAPANNVFISNNIIDGVSYGITVAWQSGHVAPFNTFQSDFNLYYQCFNAVGNFDATLAAWQSDSGKEAHSLAVDPLLAQAIAPPFNLQLQTGSPALAAASDGTAIGAYQTPAPAKPPTTVNATLSAWSPITVRNQWNRLFLILILILILIDFPTGKRGD